MTSKISDKLMEIIKKRGQPTLLDLAELTDEDISRLSMLKNLEVMFAGMGNDATLKAVRMGLEFTKAKPASTIKTNLSATWLEELAEDEPKQIGDDSGDE